MIDKVTAEGGEQNETRFLTGLFWRQQEQKRQVRKSGFILFASLRKWRELENRTEAKARVRFFFSRAQQIKY
ncbi:MAG: hypothetical protein OTI34_14845 [Lewinella sp.]|jgi:hypothetical protein|nr:hypothetical protein [Lewinella sp.]